MNKKQLYENIMRRVNNIVKHHLNESSEYTIHMNTKAVFVGDICYALDEEIYDNVWIDQLGGKDGKVADEDNLYAVVAGTACGDGSYTDEHGHVFGVDAGNIGVTDLKWCPNVTDFLNQLGLIVNIPSGQAEIFFSCSDGVFNIIIGDRVTRKKLYAGDIDTNPIYDDEDDEDEWNYDDEEYDEEYESVNHKHHKHLNEGAGAGYTVTLDGLEIDVKSVKITGHEDTEFKFTANIKPCVLDKWEAEGYYDGVSSDGIYYDGILVQEYDTEDRKVDGGIIEGNIDIDSDDIEDVIDTIKSDLSTKIKVSAMYGAGWTHANLGDTFTLNNSRGWEINENVKDTLITEVTVTAPNIGKAVDWFFNNVNDFDNIFGDDGWEEDEF